MGKARNIYGGILTKARVLFLCTHNSARSQIAEGFLRAMAGDRFEVASAGTDATRVHPIAIQAMDEIGIDMSGHSSKTIDALIDQPWDYVITVCDNAKPALSDFSGAHEACPLALR